MMNINLYVGVRHFTNDYLIKEYCKHYSKYSEIKKIFVHIFSENDIRTEQIKGIFYLYFYDKNICFEIFNEYKVENEITFANDMLNRVCIGDWLLIADIDEYIELEKIKPKFFKEEYDYIRGMLIDRLKEKGFVFDPNKNIFENYPHSYILNSQMRTTYSEKTPFVKRTNAETKYSVGHHFITRENKKACEEAIPVFHFKWNDFFTEYTKQTLDRIDLKKDPEAKGWKGEMDIYMGREDYFYSDAFWDDIKFEKIDDVYSITFG